MSQWYRNRRRRVLALESLESRHLMSGSPWHNGVFPEDVDADTRLSPLDALHVINKINQGELLIDPPGEGEAATFPDVDNDAILSPLDALLVINALNALLPPPAPTTPPVPHYPPTIVEPDEIVVTEPDVSMLLDRASRATTSQDAIIAIVDRAGKILGVRAEQGVLDTYAGRNNELVFAIDGAVAKARTAAFFSNEQAPLTSRTIRFISQSTITQREVESNPNIMDLNSKIRGPGFVAPIGVGGHFPPEIKFTPLVDLFAIEHQSRDGSRLPGLDGMKGTWDDPKLTARFDVNLDHVPDYAKPFVQLFPESYGTQSGKLPFAQSRGIATLPGGIPLYKKIIRDGKPGVVLVGGIGVFFPGTDGYATYEQGFEHELVRKKINPQALPQSEVSRLNAPRALEAEFIAYFAAGGTELGPKSMIAPVTEFEGLAPPKGDYVGIAGRIDLVGITLEIYGPTPTRSNTSPGIQQVLQVGRRNGGGQGENSGMNLEVTPRIMPEVEGKRSLRGQSVPEGWLVTPHASSVDPITADDVNTIIQQGINEAEKTRAAIRLTKDFRPGARTRMVFAVTDSTGEVLGLYRMPDATVFSIDVAVAKARNTAYYASDRLVAADQVDANNDGKSDVLPNTAFTNRTFRFLAAPRYPTGSQAGPGDFSILLMPGINPETAENLDPYNALGASEYSGANATVHSFASFNPTRNFRDPANLQRQNGVVFFPGSTPLYKGGSLLVGGFGVSGDGVDQDDVVTVAGQQGFAAPTARRADQFFVAGVRLPFQKFNRNPRG